MENETKIEYPCGYVGTSCTCTCWFVSSATLVTSTVSFMQECGGNILIGGPLYCTDLGDADVLDRLLKSLSLEAHPITHASIGIVYAFIGLCSTLVYGM